MSRETCYRCFWPKPLCWCASIQPMATRTKFVFLMHPKEFKQEKAGTGRLTHLCLAGSEIHMGVEFDQHAAVQELLRDPKKFPVLLYPGDHAINLSDAAQLPSTLAGETVTATPLAKLAAELQHRQLVILLLDATWSCARKMLKLSPTLQRLPRVMFTPTAPSRYVIKQQPQAECLSTLEATHETLLALERAGLDRYPLPAQLLELFRRMQEFQLRCASDPARDGYRRSPYKPPAERRPHQGGSGVRRSRFFRLTAAEPPVTG